MINSKLFKVIIGLFFVGFLVLYFAQSFGYYENINEKKASITAEKIKEFEEDVRNGNKIDVNNYVINIKKDYGNKVSSFGLYTSKMIAKYFKKGINGIFSGLDDVMVE